MRHRIIQGSSQHEFQHNWFKGRSPFGEAIVMQCFFLECFVIVSLSGTYWLFQRAQVDFVYLMQDPLIAEFRPDEKMASSKVLQLDRAAGSHVFWWSPWEVSGGQYNNFGLKTWGFGDDLGANQKGSMLGFKSRNPHHLVVTRDL